MLHKHKHMHPHATYTHTCTHTCIHTRVHTHMHAHTHNTHCSYTYHYIMHTLLLDLLDKWEAPPITQMSKEMKKLRDVIKQQEAASAQLINEVRKELKQLATKANSTKRNSSSSR